jgi:hypothetical protein
MNYSFYPRKRRRQVQEAGLAPVTFFLRRGPDALPVVGRLATDVTGDGRRAESGVHGYNGIIDAAGARSQLWTNVGWDMTHRE